MPETACRATISITLSEWSSRIVSHNDIELEDWVNNALAVYEAEKLACLRAAGNDSNLLIGFMFR